MTIDDFTIHEITEDTHAGETRAMFSLKASHSFAVSDALGNMLGAPKACSATTRVCCRIGYSK